jgi:hypothetical protein
MTLQVGGGYGELREAGLGVGVIVSPASTPRLAEGAAGHYEVRGDMFSLSAAPASHL